MAAERDEFKSKLEKCADYEEIKRELEVIKSIELATAGDDEEQEDASEGKTAAGGSGKEDTLEQLLLARNKKLSNELTVLRVSHRDLQNQLQSLQGDLTKTKQDLEQSQKLSRTLENDLLQMQSHTPNISSALSVAPTHASRFPPRSMRTGRVSPTSSIISGFDHSNNTLDAIRAGEPVGGGSGILPMVQAQRDRFKQKNDQLEEELAKTYATVRSLRQEVASLQKDNLNLYEKTRYVNTYNRHGGESSSLSGFGGKGSPLNYQEPGIGNTIDPSTVSRYSSAYEAQISPFAAFRGRESARAMKQMSLPERIVFSVTRLVLANRTSRNMFAAYCIAIHFLLFVFIYKLSIMSGLLHDSTLGGMSRTADGAGAPAGGVDLTQMLDGQGQGGSQGGGQLGGDWQHDG
ncbi:Cut-like homeobox [Ascosphaera pollenicola]|nr:Cut-like homeobox [Ascosphaera pollenicola]